MLWHPDARRVTYSDLGVFSMDVEPRIVWHTIEGNHLPRYVNSHPHFTYDPRNDDLWQHSPLNCGVKTLTNPAGGVETNRARAIQVELFGFARETDNWPNAWYENVADLARWIEHNAGVARTCSVDFTSSAHAMSNAKWMSYKGHCGHQHVPENSNGHWDPGQFKIGLVLDADPDVHRVLNVGERGPDVAAFQRATNRVARNCNPDYRVTVDGEFGPVTNQRGAWAVWMMGVGDSTREIKDGGITKYSQRQLREGYESLTDNEKVRRRGRRQRHCTTTDRARAGAVHGPDTDGPEHSCPLPSERDR